MNIEQLQKTLHASQYAEQVLSLHQATLEHDYAIDQFQQSLSTAQIQQLVYDHLVNIQGENTWMKVLRILRARLMFRWIWQDANQLTNVVHAQ
jgi:glutamate-ammonia-ligase adenylyltransferase